VTTTIPLVVAVGTELEEAGLVESLARPGGNLTGLDMGDWALTSKRLELLKAAVPPIRRVALLVRPSSPLQARVPSAFEREVLALGIDLLRAEVEGPETFEAAFAAMAAHQADALVIMPGGIAAVAHRHRLLELALRQRLPTIAPVRPFAQDRGEDSQVRQAAAEALGQFGLQAITSLSAALQDRVTAVRQAAATALLMIYRSDRPDDAQKSRILPAISSRESALVLGLQPHGPC
jgi:DNA-binding LacI/PurR family transcriptional regulator